MFDHLYDIARSHNLCEWRDNLNMRRALVVAGVVTIVDYPDTNLEEVLSELRQLAHYFDLGHNDRAVFRKNTSYVRCVSGGWFLLSPCEQADFRAGANAPSATVKLIKKRMAKF